MRGGMLMWALCVLGTAVGIHAQERIADVRSLDDLRGLKGVSVDKSWEIRVGLGDGGNDSGPWTLVYCLARHLGQEERSVFPFIRDAVEPLGPVKLEVAWDKQERMMDATRRDVPRMEVKRGVELLFCTAVVLNHAGICHISIRRANDALLLARDVEVKEPRTRLWHSLAALERYTDVAGDTRFRYRMLDTTMEHRPEYGGMRRMPIDAAPKIDPAGYPATASLLPGAIPMCEEWWSPLFPGVKLGAENVALELSLKDGEIIVRSKVGKMVDWADEYLLARWWVNGKPIVPPPGRPSMRMAGRRVGETDQMTIVFGLPQTLGKLRLGDKVGLQVLYCPDGTTPITDELGMALHRAAGETGALSAPLLSNRIEFAVKVGM